VREQTNLNIERDYIDILRGYPLFLKRGDLSNFVNEFLKYMALGEDELTPSQIREKIKYIAIEKRKKLLEQSTIIEPEPVRKQEEKKIRCWDKGQESYAMIPVSDLELHPEWYTVDEEIRRYEE
jgi:hypothetical protein